MAKAETLPSTCYETSLPVQQGLWYQWRPGRPPPLPTPSDDDASEDEDDDIEFHSDESHRNDGVEDEARFHSYDEPQLASKALFFWSWWTPINVRMDDPFQWKMFTIECQ